jgi:iron complex transport system substrate-binding protein
MIPSPPVPFARQKVTGFLIFKRRIWSAPAIWSALASGARHRFGSFDRGSRSKAPSTLRSAGALQIAILLAVCILCGSSCIKLLKPSGPVYVGVQSHEVTDEAGRKVLIPAKIDRIVSLAPNLTEIVYAVGAGDRLVGVTSYCDYPAEARAVAKVGDTMKPSIERIIALKPQIVLVSTASQLENFTKQLDEQTIAVYVTNPNSADQIFRSIETLGGLFGTSDQAKQLAAELRRRTQAVEAAVANRPPVRVFYQVSDEPLYTIGRDAYLTDLIRRAGGVSVTADVPTAFPRYSDEAALASRPEAIILPTGGSMGSANAKVTAALNNSPAVRNNRVHKINDDLLARPGPRLIDGLEALARALHPEAFK